MTDLHDRRDAQRDTDERRAANRAKDPMLAAFVDIAREHFGPVAVRYTRPDEPQGVIPALSIQ